MTVGQTGTLRNTKHAFMVVSLKVKPVGAGQSITAGSGRTQLLESHSSIQLNPFKIRKNTTNAARAFKSAFASSTEEPDEAATRKSVLNKSSGIIPLVIAATAIITTRRFIREVLELNGK